MRINLFMMQKSYTTRYEELTWEPGRKHDHDLLMYLRAVRSMAAFAGRIIHHFHPEKNPASSTMIFYWMHFSLAKINRLIRTEFLPEKETGDLITYYYLWKKTPAASSSRPRGKRHRSISHSFFNPVCEMLSEYFFRPTVLRRVKSTKEKNGVKKEANSASEVEDS